MEPQIGDVLVTRSGKLGGRLIRLGAALQDQPNITNHVAVVHHQDAAGTWWAIEARPGGVGFAAAAQYIESPWTVGNGGQAKSTDQREQIARVLEGMLGRPYDWRGIVVDAMIAIGARDRWAQDWRGAGPPAHVVCSSLAAWAYREVGLDYPTYDLPRFTTPAHWEAWITENRLHC